MYLHKENVEAVALFLSCPAWQDLKRCLLLRRPEGADPSDQPHVAAAKGFRRDAWEETIAMLEKIPLETDPGQIPDPFNRPATNDRD